MDVLGLSLSLILPMCLGCHYPHLVSFSITPPLPYSSIPSLGVMQVMKEGSSPISTPDLLWQQGLQDEFFVGIYIPISYNLQWNICKVEEQEQLKRRTKTSLFKQTSRRSRYKCITNVSTFKTQNFMDLILQFFKSTYSKLMSILQYQCEILQIFQSVRNQ